jgi:alpha-glucosidase
MVMKDPALPDLTDEPGVPHPYIDRDELHEVYRGWRAIADSYPGARILVGEVWLPDAERFARYLRPDEMHTAFNFDFLACPWEADRLRTSIDVTLAAHAPVSAPATWVLCNHDVTRTVTRYGRADTGFDFATKAFGIPTDLELGTRRARAAALLTLALPGSVYLYQGEELGLPEVEDIPLDKLQDPMYLRSGDTNPGRDGCRVPLPWSGEAPPFGFSPAGAAAEPWLPQPADWAARTAEAQAADPDSMLTLYRAALRLRRAEPGLGDGTFAWLESAPGVLTFRRSPEFVFTLNLAEEPAELPPHTQILLTSAPLTAGRLPADTAAWLRG